MRWLIVGLLAGLGGCLTDTRFEVLAMTERPVAAPAQVEVATLSNGLRVALLRDPRARVASIDLRYEVGAADDPGMLPGLSLFVAEVLAGIPRGDAALTERLAVDLDRTELTTTTLDVAAALETTARRLDTTCADFTPQLAVALDETLAQLSSTSGSFGAAVWGAQHPYAHVLGDPLVARAPPDQLCGFFHAHYGPAAATLVVTGALGADQMAAIRTRFEAIPRRTVVPRAPIPVIETSQRKRVVVFGLARPTAALIFSVPSVGDRDDVTAELAARWIATWDDKLHVMLVGGRRGRALVIAREADREGQLGAAHEKLHDALAKAYDLELGDGPDISVDELLDAAQELDDVNRRGERIAELVGSGRPVDLVRRIRSLVQPPNIRRWIREHLTEATPRMLDLIPAGPGGGPVEALAEPPSATTEVVVDSSGALPPVPARHRSAIDYTLGNGLRVVLAPDPGALTVDLRLVLPIGTADEPAQGLALRAATELIPDDGWDAGPDAQHRMEWYGQRPVHSDVDVTQHSTQFRVVGLAELADWHLFGLAWHVTMGHYKEFGRMLDQIRRRYGPQGSTLIVSGGFDPVILRARIATWFGGWHPAPVAAKPPAAPAAVRPRVIETAGAEVADLWLVYEAPQVDRAAARLLASVVRDRLVAATRTSATITVDFDSRDRKLAIAAQLDPAAAQVTATTIARELERLRVEAPTADELARARRHALATVLGAEIGVSGRARQLEAAVLAGEPVGGPEPDLDALRTLEPDEVQTAAISLFDPAHLTFELRCPNGIGTPVLAAFRLKR